MPSDIVYFAHGQKSGPWGTKIVHLAEIAKRRGFQVESPDYSGLNDPDERAQRLLELAPRNAERLVLVGSSAGGYVSAAAAETLNPAGLFLLAPAVLLPGFGRRTFQPAARPLATHQWVVHGWEDDVVPAQGVIRFAQQHRMQLHLLNGDHRLVSVLSVVGDLFDKFLEAVSGNSDQEAI